MPTKKSSQADILILGAQPTEEDDHKGEPFHSPGGALLRRALPSYHRNRFAFQNLVRCHSFATPNIQEIHACSEYLDEDMVGIKAIIGVGQSPLFRFFPDAAVSMVWLLHGLRMVVEIADKKYWYLPVNDMYGTLKQDTSRNPEYGAEFSVLRAEIKEFLSVVDTLPKPRITQLQSDAVLLPETPDEAMALIADMSEPVGLDLEATALKPYLRGGKLLSAAFSDGKITVAVPIHHQEASSPWGLDVLRYVVTNKTWVAHSASMELVWARYTFPDEHIMPCEDSRAAARLYFQRSRGTNLATVSRIVLGVNVKALSDLAVSRLNEYPLEEVLRYNGLDAQACRLVWDKLRPKVQDQGYNRIMGAIESTVEMELLGLEVSQDKVNDLRSVWQTKMYEAEKAAYQVFEVKAWQAVKGEEFRMTATQLGDVLVNYAHIPLPQTGKLNYKTDEETLQEFAADHPLGKAVLEYREAEKQLSTYIEACAKVDDFYVDGLLHPSYDPMHTATLRLASSNPNIQNFPKRRHRVIRSIIVPGEGKIMMPIDFGQLEARILAMVSKDRAFCQSIIEGVDIHSKWLNRALQLYPDYLERLARKTNQTEEAKIRKGARDVIKTDMVFASFYGSTAASCSRKTGIPLEIMMQLSTEFWQEYAGVKRWIDAQRKNYQATGDIVTATGRVRHAVVPGNEVINNPIQGVAADIVLDCQNELSKLSRARRDPYLHPRINIHDDLTFILPDNDSAIERYMQEIADVMTKIRYKFQIVPLMVEASIGYNWADITPLWKHTGDYVR